MDEAGNSPFWDGLAGRFFDMTFPEADEFNAVHGSDSPETAQFEIGYFFPGMEIFG